MKNVTLSGNLPKRNSFALFIDSNRNKIVEVIAALFIVLFVYTAINKFIDRSSLKIALQGYPLIGNFSTLIAWGLPITESIVALLLFFPKTRSVGLYASLILMTGFTLYVAYMLLFAPKLPCTCGGLLQKLSWPQHLVFNIIFFSLVLWGISLQRKKQVLQPYSEIAPVVFT